MTKFQAIVKKYREDQGLSLRDFAQAVGFSHAAIGDWENGKYEPETWKLLELALQGTGWAREFAFDCLAALRPDVYKPIGEIGKMLLSPVYAQSFPVNDNAPTPSAG